MTTNPELQFYPIAIGHYRHHPPVAGIDAELTAITDLFADFGAEAVEWSTPMADRNGDATHARLDDWASEAHPHTVLYWVGHGWSNGVEAVLAHAASPNPPGANGITPARLAEAIAARDPGGEEGWVIVIIDACRSADVVQRLSDAVDRQPGARRVLLIGTSGEHSTTLGRFREILDRILRLSFRTDQEVRLWSLSEELKRNLPEHAEVVFKRLDVDTAVLRRTRTIQLPAGPMDVLAEVSAVLAELTEEERQHFIPKAQAAELGEPFWYFQGRTAEAAQVSAWLRDQHSGMLVITGEAGSGKSALLGYLLTQSRPALRQTLARHQLLAESSPEQRPSDNVFDVVLHLTGRTLSDTIADISTQARLGNPPSHARITSELDWLATATRRRTGPLTILADALDEAVEPHATATAILRRLATFDGVRVVVGTRASTSEHIDHPVPTDRDLLDALRATADNTITISKEPKAIGRYVRQRLTRALPAADAELITDASVAIGSAGRPFLFARLAVHEIAADPALLEFDNLDVLLTGDHRTLFTRAISRLTRVNHRYQPLLRALAYSRGRGLPALGGVWADIATAIAAIDASDAPPITDRDIAHLAHDAAPYLLLDREHDHTVYRLAHRSFAEHFTTDTHPTPTDQLIHHAITGHLIETAGQHLNPYLTHYLSAHAGLGGSKAWEDLADHTGLLDQLNPTAVAADAMRTAFGRISLPPAITGILGAGHHLHHAAPADRRGLRQLAMTRHTTITAPATREPTQPETWSVRWAARTHSPSHLTLTSHASIGSILAVTTLALPDGRVLLASGSQNGTVSLWDPVTGTPYGQPLTGHTGAVWALAGVPLPDGRVLLASGSNDDTIRLWDPVTGNQHGQPLIGHRAMVWALTVVPLPDGRTLLASGSDDRTVLLWDPITGHHYGETLVGHTGGVWALTVVVLPDQRVLLASGSADHTVQLWDPTTGSPYGQPLGGHVGDHFSGVDALAPVTLADGQRLLATGSHDRTMRLWDPVTGESHGQPLRGHTSGVSAVAPVTLSDGQRLLATGSHDGTMRLWDPATGHPYGQPFRGHTGEVSSVAVVPLPDGRVLVATGSHDSTVRLWNPNIADTPQPSGHAGRVSAMAAVPLSDGRVVLATGSQNSTVRLWDPATGDACGEPLSGHTRQVFAITAVPLSDGRVLLATGSQDSTVRLWDPATGDACGEALGGHTGGVLALSTVALPDGRTLLASGSADHTVRLWDPATGNPYGQPLRGHTGGVWALTTVSLSDRRVLLASGSHETTVRLWDPLTGDPHGQPLRSHKDWVSALTAITLPHGQVLLASGGHDHSTRLWDPNTGLPCGEPLRGHTHSVSTIAPISLPDGQVLLATGSHDRTVRLWNPSTGTCQTTVNIGEPVSKIVHLTDDAIAVALGDGIAVLSLGID